jgi:hypothetical protein
VGSECTWARWHDAAMDAGADPYPIVLRAWGGSIRRRAWSAAIPILILSSALIAYDVVVGFDCDYPGCSQPWVLGVGGIVGAVVIAAAWYQRGRRGLELRIDRDGFIESGGMVPWEAVMSILWNQGQGGESPIPEHIEVRVRNIEGYRAPRDHRVQVNHREYGVPANVLIDAFEAAALPRRIYVLAVEPPAKG